MAFLPVPALVGGVLAVLVLVSSSCVRTKGHAAEDPLSVVARQDVPQEFEREHRALVDALRGDPSGPATASAAHALLARGAPAELAASAHLALAQHAYLNEDDPKAADQADEGLELSTTPDTRQALTRVLALALVRSGDPARAVEVLGSADLALRREERAALSAVARDRAGGGPQAVSALVVQGRMAHEAGRDAEATYALARARIHLQALSPNEREKVVRDARGPDGACLRAMANGAPAARGFASLCLQPEEGAAGPVVGVLVPQSGRARGLYPEVLAATAAARAVAEAEAGSILLEDAGEGPGQAAAAWERLSARGATVAVGPVTGAALTGPGVVQILPGPGSGGAKGVAPTLERRVEALAGACPKCRFLVFAGEHTYGDRAVAHLEKILGQSRSKRMTLQRYPASQTTFAPVLKAAQVNRCAAGCAVMILDAAPRADLLVRQLRRSVGDPPGPMVLTTGEGMAALKDLGGLEGAVLAPPAVAEPGDLPFVQAFERQEGRAPSAESLLLARALRHAMAATLPADPVPAVLATVRGGVVVPR